MEWTRDKTLSLINEYKKRRGLWDMTHEDYRKKEMKQKLLLEVSASLGGGIPIVEIEKKFHTLRTQYHREINRMKRKEPYNSKWFGFKNLQFLSSPKAMRAGKGKLNAEITEDGVTKYIIREATSRDTDVDEAVAAAASSSITTEFLTIHRNKPTSAATGATTTVTYESSPTTLPTPIAIGRTQKFESNRARDLEKLIEETTKDVEEPEESKQKIIKEISLPLQHHSYSSTSMTTQEESQSQHHHQTQHQQEHHVDEEHLSTIDIQANVDDDNMAYHSHHHQHQAPTRVFKIQRRDTCHEDEYYEEEHHQHQQHQQHSSSMQGKRIYYDNGTSSGNIITAGSPSSGGAIPMSKLQPVQTNTRFRDEFTTYGEYVANEMRTICNREIMISLKHKINTALFEASMAELQQK